MQVGANLVAGIQGIVCSSSQAMNKMNKMNWNERWLRRCLNGSDLGDQLEIRFQAQEIARLQAQIQCFSGGLHDAHGVREPSPNSVSIHVAHLAEAPVYQSLTWQFATAIFAFSWKACCWVFYFVAFG